MAEEDRIGLADFLTDLRAELSEAQSRAAGDSLKLGVEEISLTLEVAYTLAKGGGRPQRDRGVPAARAALGIKAAGENRLVRKL